MFILKRTLPIQGYCINGSLVLNADCRMKQIGESLPHGEEVFDKISSPGRLSSVPSILKKKTHLIKVFTITLNVLITCQYLL